MSSLTMACDSLSLFLATHLYIPALFKLALRTMREDKELP